MADIDTAPMTAEERARAMLSAMTGKELPNRFRIGLAAIRAAEQEAEQRGEERAIAVVLDHLSETTAGYLVAAIRARAKQTETA